MKLDWQYLSYTMSAKLSGYGNGKRITIDKVREICRGDSSNNSELSLSSHFGTHIDFPFHFAAEGKNGEDYEAKYFIHKNVQIIAVRKIPHNRIIKPQDFKQVSFRRNTTFLIIKTGYCNFRNEDRYWNDNPGFAPELAGFFKKKMPHLQMIGFDSISLSGWKNRELGREAHKKFLTENEILVVEDMDLSALYATSKIRQAIVSPLLFENCDGTPVTIFAKIER